MFNRTDGMQPATPQRIADGTERATAADTASRADGAATSASKAEEMVALLANRIRRSETRR